MAERKLTDKELAERDRLVAWMKANGHDSVSLGAATGDFYTGIHVMLEGKRRISQGFKWRFLETFGYEETAKTFLPHLVSEAVT